MLDTVAKYQWLDSLLLPLVSVLVASYLYSTFTNKFHRRQASFNIAIGYVNDKQLQDCIRKLYKEQQKVNKILQGNKSQRALKSQEDFIKHIDYVLNYFEVLSFAMRNKDIDERIMRKTFRYTLLYLYNKFKPYNENLMRELPGFKGFENLMYIGQKWADGEHNWFCYRYIRTKRGVCRLLNTL